MIPKIIHYCWIGSKTPPQFMQKCIASWRRVMPDYEIKLWNENNYDFRKNKFMANAYAQKGGLGFVPDYARLDIVYHYGGIYFDTDVEAVKPFDEFLKYPAFCGFDSKHFVNFGHGFGAEKGNKVIKDLMTPYENMELTISEDIFKQACLYVNLPIREWEKRGLPISPFLQTQTLINKYGLKQNNSRQSLGGMEVFPSSYFSPKNDLNLPAKTDSAYSIHWYTATWSPAWPKIKWKIVKCLRRIIGIKRVEYLLGVNRKIRKIFK